MKEINAYENAKKQIKNSISLIWDEKYEKYLDVLSNPKRILEVNIPVKMDDGSIKVFTWYRSQHNDTKWPFKWGIRFHQDVSRDEVKALSIWMSLKTSVVWLPLWWGKWGIIVDPKTLSARELEELSRWYVRAIFSYLWAEKDVPAPDVNTNWQVMAWMMDEYSKLAWVNVPWSFTWKPLDLGGSKWRETATSMWWVYVLEKYLEIVWDDVKWKTFVVQWAWNVWLNFAEILVRLWAKLLAISDSRWWIYSKEGLDIQKIVSLKKDRKSVTDYSWVDFVTNEEILEIETDILVPAALENQITSENADNIKSKIILELANGPVTPEADEILNKNNIVVIPDVLANAWWVMVSYFEQVQNNANYYWSEEEVDTKLKSQIQLATTRVVDKSREKGIDLRKWAYVLSLKTIIDSMILRW